MALTLQYKDVCTDLPSLLSSSMDSPKATRRLTAYVGLACIACVLSLAFMISGSRGRASNNVYSARSIYENTSPQWDIGSLPPKLMYFEPTVHYELNTTAAAAEWAALFPHDGVVRIGEDREPYTISMFHQLRCLDVIRRAYIVREALIPEGPSTVSLHCMQYLRQMVLCRRDTRLEPVVDPTGAHAVQPWGTMTCKDWTAVYDAQARNARGE